MSRRRFTLCGLLAGFAILAGSATRSLQASEVTSLPADPSTPVIELWYVDSNGLNDPEVAIFAGGRVRVRLGEGAIWGQLEQKQIGELIRSLLVQDRLSQLKTPELEQAIERESLRTGLSCRIRGAADTIIRVRTADEVYRIDGHAVGLLATRFPEVPEIQLLYSAQSRLENIRAIIMVGGTPAAERLARLAQQQVQVESGEQITVRQEHLTTVHSLNDGTRCCQFLVRDDRSPAGPMRVISLVESPGETPRVSVLPDGPIVR